MKDNFFQWIVLREAFIKQCNNKVCFIFNTSDMQLKGRCGLQTARGIWLIYSKYTVCT